MRSGRAIGLDLVPNSNSMQRGFYDNVNPRPTQNLDFLVLRPDESSSVCELCEEEFDEWGSSIQPPPPPVRDRTNVVEWCSDCDKHDVGPPCKCSQGPPSRKFIPKQSDSRSESPKYLPSFFGNQINSINSIVSSYDKNLRIFQSQIQLCTVGDFY